MDERRALLHCNAGSDFGMGHLVRTLSVAQAAQERGWSLSVVGDIDEAGCDIARRMSPEVRIIPARDGDLAERLASATGDVELLHVDSYWDVPRLTGGRAVVSNMQDGPFGVRDSDLAIDANLGSERSFRAPGRSRVQMAGIDLAVVRRQVLRQRGRPPRAAGRPRVLVVIGGTDPHGVTVRVVDALRRISVPLSVTVIDPRSQPEVNAASATSPHTVRVMGFVDDLPALARDHDIVITAAGTSVWDFACMGLPMAVVCVADNQRENYRTMMAHGLAIGLGELAHEDLDTRVRQVGEALASASGLASASERLERLVDGLGTWRIVSAWEQLVAIPVSAAPDTSGLVPRAATRDDALTLFDWRNDPETRRGSRSHEPVAWEDHVRWFDNALRSPDRKLLIVESDDEPVATCRWDRRTVTDWEVSITVDPSRRNLGLGGSVLSVAEAALDAPAPYRMLATVHRSNAASARLFARAGYLPHRPSDEAGFAVFAKWRLRSDR